MLTPPSGRGLPTAARPCARATATAALVAAALLTACGSDGDDDATGPSGREPVQGDTALLEAATFVSTSVDGHELVPGTEVRLSFDEDTLAVSGGCNTSFGAYRLVDGMLSWEEGPATTMIACSDEASAQDQW